MAATRWDTIVVGGGVAGLMSAIRLAALGDRVAVFDQGLIGGQATTGNHGIVHSGAFYAKWHPEMVPYCQDAVALYTKTFPQAVLALRSYGYGLPENVDDMISHWERLRCPYEHVAAEEVAYLFNDDCLQRRVFVAGNDASMSTRLIVVALAALARSCGVALFPHCAVAHLRVHGGRVVGVTLNSGGHASARRVVLCAALGTWALTREVGIRLEGRLRSRLDMMVAFRGEGLRNVVLSHDFGGPNVAPAPGGVVLASPYGGEQPPVNRYRRWSVPLMKVLSLVHDLEANFREGLIELDSAHAYMCSKTEYTGRCVDQFGGQPGFAVIDHEVEDGVGHLWTLMPGKMTLAFHASHALASMLTSRDLPLELPATGAAPADDCEQLVDLYPWYDVSREAAMPAAAAATKELA